MRFDMLAINIFSTMVSGVTLLFYLKWNGIQLIKSRKLLFVLIFGLLNGPVSTISSIQGDFVYTIKPLLLLALGIVIIKHVLDIRWLKSVSLFCLLMIGIGVSSSIWSLIIGIFITKDIKNVETTNAPFYLLSNIVVAVLTMLFLIATRSIRKKMFELIISNKGLVIGLILTFFIISANAGLYYYVKAFKLEIFLVMTILSIMYCVFLILYVTLIHKQKIKKTEQEQQEFYNKSLENSLFNLRRFKHDWNNHLTVINSMLVMNKNNEVREYLREIMEHNSTNNDTSIYSIKNAGLFGIISSKQGLAREKGLNIDIKGIGEICSIPEIKISELCEIIGIFLDNAIEESVKVSEPIELNYCDSPEYIEIKIINKCQDDIDISKLGKYSSKGAGRGNGLRIVDQIINKHKYVKNYRTYELDSKTFEQSLVVEKGL